MGGPDDLVRTYDYIYDLAGNRCAALESDGAYGGGGDIITDQICGGADLPTPDEHLTAALFEFDALNQLMTQTEVGGATQHYTYDLAGNLTSVGTSAGLSDIHAYTFDAAHRLVGHQDGATSTLSAYAYDGLGDRYQQTVGTETTDYILDRNAQLTQVLGEIGLSDATYYLPGIGQQTGTDWAYFGTDGLGSVRNMFDSTGAITYAADFDPYGGLINQYVGTNTNLGFTGEQTNANGLVYLRARHYDPGIGVFLSRDPVLGAIGGRSIRFNGYAYAGANPVNYVDPDGEFFLLAALGWAAFWFARGAIIDVGMQIVLEGRADDIDWGRAVFSGGIDMVTSGIGSALKGAGYAARTINRLDYVADTLLSAGVDSAYGGQDFGEALVGNAVIGGLFRGAAHQLGRAVNTQRGQAIIRQAQRGIGAVARGAGRAVRYIDNQLLRAGGWYAQRFDLNAVGSGPFPVLRRSPRRMVLELFSGPQSQIRRNVPGYGDATVANVDISWYSKEQGGVLADATRLSFASNSVDEVFITNPYNVALRYAGERDAFKWAYFTEVARVLRPGGRAIVSAEVSISGGFVNRFARVWGEGNLRPELRELGFKVRRQDFSGLSPYGPLHPALRGQHFGKPDSLIPGAIPTEKMGTIVLTWGD